MSINESLKDNKFLLPTESPARYVIVNGFGETIGLVTYRDDPMELPEFTINRGWQIQRWGFDCIEQVDSAIKTVAPEQEKQLWEDLRELVLLTHDLGAFFDATPNEQSEVREKAEQLQQKYNFTE